MRSHLNDDDFHQDTENSPANPLDWIAGQCRFRRRMSVQMEQLAAAPDYDETASFQIIDWLKVGLPAQFRDSADDLFPLLRSRARRDDDFAGVMATLEADHEAGSALIRRIVPRLEALRLINHPVPMEPPVAAGLTDLAIRERQHVALLTKVILPIARLRLIDADLALLQTNMSARRHLA